MSPCEQPQEGALPALHTPDHWSLIAVDLERGEHHAAGQHGGGGTPEQMAMTKGFVEARLALEGRPVVPEGGGATGRPG